MILYSQGDTKFKVKLEASNFDDDDYQKIQMAINKIAKAVSSTEFKNFVLDYKYTVTTCKGWWYWKECTENVRYGMRYNYTDWEEDQTQQQIYDHIISGKERLIPEVDEEADIFLELDKNYKPGVLGYTYPSTSWQWIYNWFFTDGDYHEIAGNIFHEYCHKLSYKHESDYNSLRRHTVPYACGYFVRDFV